MTDAAASTTQSHATAPQPYSKARRWGTLAVLTASLLVITMDMTILNIAIPDLTEHLRPSADQVLWIVDSYSLVLAGLLVTCTALADRWGRKRMLLIGYTIFGGTSLLVLWATNAEAVIALRVLLGVGGAMIMPTTLSLIRVVFKDPRERTTALGIWAAASSLGAAFGPLIGGALLERFSWQSAFLINVPLMVVALVAGIFVLPESKLANPGRIDPLGVVLSLAGMTLFIWSVKEFAVGASLANTTAWVALLASLALLAWFAVRCLRSDAPLLDLRLFRSRPFSAGIIGALGSSFAMGSALLLLAQWMQLVDGATPVETGMRLFPAAIGGAISALLAPVLARWTSPRAVLAGGIASAGLGMILIGVQPGTLSTLTVLIAITLVGVGTGALAIGSALIMSGSPEERAGSAAALEETAYELGSVLGVAILGSVAALWYRANFTGFVWPGTPDPAAVADAESSLGGAIAVAQKLGLPELAHEAGIAFTHSMQWTGIIGGGVLVAVAITIFFLTPKGTSVTDAQH